MAPREGVFASSKCDEGKTWRFNFQHNLAVRVNNGLLLHPSIPGLRVKNVADVGTSTGLAESKINASMALIYHRHGFQRARNMPIEYMTC